MTTTEKKSERIAYIDVAAGLMVFWMVFGHWGHFAGWSPLRGYILGFFMPWFFYKSGFLFRPKDYRDLAKKDAKKFLRTFVQFSLLGWVVWCTCMIISRKGFLYCVGSPLYLFARQGCVLGNNALWFLISIFLVREIFNYLIIRKINVFFVAIGAYAIAYGLSLLGWQNVTWWFGNMFSGLGFFAIGYQMKNYEQKPMTIILAVAVVVFFVLMQFMGWIEVPYLYMHANKMFRGNYLLFLPWAVAGIVFVNNFFRLTGMKLKYHILGWIGSNALPIYVTHWIVLTVASYLCKGAFGIETPRTLWLILVIVSIVFLPIICQLFSWIKNRHLVSAANRQR